MARADGKVAREYIEELMSQPISRVKEQKLLDELKIPFEQQEGLTYNEIFWRKLLQKALNGDMKAMTEIIDRRYGKAPQHILTETRTLTYVKFLDDIEKIEAQELEVVSVDVDRGPPKELTIEDLGLI